MRLSTENGGAQSIGGGRRAKPRSCRPGAFNASPRKHSPRISLRAPPSPRPTPPLRRGAPAARPCDGRPRQPDALRAAGPKPGHDGVVGGAGAGDAGAAARGGRRRRPRPAARPPPGGAVGARAAATVRASSLRRAATAVALSLRACDVT